MSAALRIDLLEIRIRDYLRNLSRKGFALSYNDGLCEKSSDFLRNSHLDPSEINTERAGSYPADIRYSRRVFRLYSRRDWKFGRKDLSFFWSCEDLGQDTCDSVEKAL